MVSWVVKKLEFKVDEAVETFDKLLEKGVLYHVDGHTSFENSDGALYKFQADRTDIAANLVYSWAKEFRKPMQVSVELLNKLIGVYKEVVKESEEGKCKLQDISDSVHSL